MLEQPCFLTIEEHTVMTTITIGLDLGTTGCKAVAVNQDGHVLERDAAEYPLIRLEEGQAEQDAMVVYEAACATLRSLVSRLETPPSALALSGAMHSLLPVDNAGNPLANALTWADTRPGLVLEKLRASVDPLEVYTRTGCPVQTPFHLAKLVWLRETQPDVFKSAARFVAIKDFVVYRLTGRWATDVSLASTTGLFNLHTQKWDAELLALAGVDESHVLEVIDSLETHGQISANAARETGLPIGLRVVAGGSDGALANLGAGVITPGSSVITVGTSGALRRAVAEPLLDPQARTWCYRLSKHHLFAGGAINNAGLLLEWLRESFYRELDRESGFEALLLDAASIPPGADGLTVLPYLTGERSPHWQSDLEFTLHGARLRHTRAHVARAALESIAFCIADIRTITGTGGAIKLTGGITRSRTWMQTLSDVLETPLEPVDAADASAIGAATIARANLLGQSLESGTVPSSAGEAVIPDSRTFDALRSARTRFHSVFNQLHPKRGPANAPKSPLV
jgi:gluconokinase